MSQAISPLMVAAVAAGQRVNDQAAGDLRSKKSEPKIVVTFSGSSCTGGNHRTVLQDSPVRIAFTMRFVLIALGSIAALGVQLSFPIALAADDDCDPAYPGVCIPPPPPDLDCRDIEYRNFTVLDPDPHNFDGDGDGIGCERRQ
jgi:hypothetical protein